MKRLAAAAAIVAMLTAGVLWWKLEAAKKELAPLIDRFYTDFIAEDYRTMYTYFDDVRTDGDYDSLPEETKMGIVAQKVMNDRHWYGAIRGSEPVRYLWRGIGVVEVTVRVTAGDESEEPKRYEDKLLVGRDGTEWKIKQYRSGSPWRTMVMP